MSSIVWWCSSEAKNEKGLSRFISDDAGRDTGNDSVSGNIFHDHGVCADRGVVTNFYRPDNFGADAHKNTITKDGNPVVMAAAANCDIVADYTILADDSVVVNHNTEPAPIQYGVSANRGRIWKDCFECDAAEAEDQPRQERDPRPMQIV